MVKIQGCMYLISIRHNKNNEEIEKMSKIKKKC